MYIYESTGNLYDGEGDVEEGLDYLKQTEQTASNAFNPQNVGVVEFTYALSSVIHAAQEMDKFKKALFRQRTRKESGLEPLAAFDIDLNRALASPDSPEAVENYADLFHGIVGAITEVGELAEVLMDRLTTNKEPDQTNVREEIGDVLWYLARLVTWSETTFLTEMQRNIAKLRLRHGTGGFSKTGDITRDIAAEHALLSGDQPAGQYAQDVASGEMTAEEAEMYSEDEEKHPEDYHKEA